MLPSSWFLRLILLVISYSRQTSAYVSPMIQTHLRIQQHQTISLSSTSEDQQQTSQQQENPFRATGKKEVVMTLTGGLAAIFKKAQSYNGNNGLQEQQRAAVSEPVPRWHPHSGIRSENPDFRTSAPVMSNSGFAKSIWRNVRKRNKPRMWQNALRTYDRMSILEEQKVSKIKLSNIHHEGAMLACAKLGLWQKCLEIYHLVDEQDTDAILPPTASRTRTTSSTSTINQRVFVTDDMIQSLIRACTRASNQRGAKFKGNHELEEEEAALRRIPLDTALEILRTQEENHNIPVAANHVNPLAAAYQSLGYVEQARDTLQSMLANRTAGEEPEGDGIGVLNVHDLCAKDKGSYSLLVQGAVRSGDWGAAVEALGDMTRSGLYPNSRHCNSWNELSERHRRRCWKKKRDDFWMDSVSSN